MSYQQKSDYKRPARPTKLEDMMLQIADLKRRRTYLSDFSALPGEENDTCRFQRAIAATPTGGELVVPDGYYFADSIQIHKNISVIFQGHATIEATKPNKDILIIEGSRDEQAYVLAQPVKRGDRALFFQQTPAVEPGDLIILTDDTVRRSDRQKDMNNEIHEVVQVINHNPNLIQGDEDGIANSPNPQIKDRSQTNHVYQLQQIALTQDSGHIGITQKIAIQSSQTYSFQLETKLAESSGDFKGVCYLVWYQANGKSIGQKSIAEDVTKKWSKMTLPNIRPPKEAVSCKVFLGADTADSACSMQIRNINIQEASACIVLRDFVRLPKAISQSGVNVYKINPLENIVVKNFNFVMKPGSVRGSGLVMRYIRGALITDTQGARGAGSGIQVLKSIFVNVKGFRFVKPQVTGSGQGYGVQFYGGCSGIIIQDGYTLDCRHSVDLDSTYDAYVENVFDYNSHYAAFMMSHNGCCSDITFQNCQTLFSHGSGFVADSQGFANPLDCVFYNFNVIGCTAVVQDRAPAAVYWTSPCKNSIVRDCKLRFDSGTGEEFAGLQSSGVRLYPAKTEVLISGCDISGFRCGISMQILGNRQLENDQSQVTIRDTTIKNGESAIFCYQGKGKRLSIFHLDCQQIHKQLLALKGEVTFDEIVVDGISLLNSPQCQFSNEQITASNNWIQGIIQNLRSDFPAYYQAKKNWQLTETLLYLVGDGESFYLNGTGATSSNQPLPNGLVEGQRLTLVTTQGTWKILRGTNMLFLANKKEINLDHYRRTLSLIWHGGKWIEM